MRVVIRVSSRKQTCPPEEFWSSGRPARIYEHLTRCEACRLRAAEHGVNDWVPARLVAGIVAAVVLAGAIRLTPRYQLDASALTLAPMSPVIYYSPAPKPVEPPMPELPLVADIRPATPPVPLAALEPVGPKRPFVPPPRKAKHVETAAVVLPPPVILNARLIEAPALPLATPKVPPPPKSALRKFVSALAVPFRHI